MELLERISKEMDRAIAARDEAALKRVLRELMILEEQGLPGVTEMFYTAVPE